MKIGAGEIRAGMLIEYQGKMCLVTNSMHRTPGNLRAFMQVEMKDMQSGTKYNNRFATDEMVERISLDESAYTYLFNDGVKYTFMHTGTYEQIEVDAELLGEKAVYLQDGMEVSIQSYEEKPVNVKFPDTVVLEVSEADPVVKGQTAAASYKPAVLENGVKVMVPPFVTTGDKIVVKTEDSSYVERAK